jgi:hypothetical protein
MNYTKDKYGNIIPYHQSFWYANLRYEAAARNAKVFHSVQREKKIDLLLKRFHRQAVAKNAEPITIETNLISAFSAVIGDGVEMDSERYYNNNKGEEGEEGEEGCM